MPSSHDRRKHRSNSQHVALSLQLLASRQRIGARTVVLADHYGRIIARSNDDMMADDVASFGPVLALPKSWNGKLRFDGNHVNVTITPVDLGTKRGYICSLGANVPDPSPELKSAGNGVRRILNQANGKQPL